MKLTILLVCTALVVACASPGGSGEGFMTAERSILELQRVALERLLAGVEPYLADRRLEVLCVVPAVRTTDPRTGGLRWMSIPDDRRSRGPANWLVARVHPEGRQLVASLDCQHRDTGWIVRETGEAAATLNVGGLIFRTGTDATVEMSVNRSRREFMTFTCRARREANIWTMYQCICGRQRGAAAICLII